jgi:hypothetical protein
VQTQQKRLKSIPAFLREDAPFGHSKLYDLIRSGELEAVRIGKRWFIVMASFERLCKPSAAE